MDRDEMKRNALDEADFTDVFQAKTAWSLGYDAGHAAATAEGIPQAEGWVAIETVDDLPCEVGEYLWKRRDAIPGDFQHQHCFWSGALQRSDDYVERFEAWMPIPPYQHKSEGDSK